MIAQFHGEGVKRSTFVLAIFLYTSAEVGTASATKNDIT